MGDEPKFGETIQARKEQVYKTLIERFQLQDADGQIKRVADAFVLYARAGILASADYLGVLTHNVTGIVESIFAMFGSWFKDRGGSISFEEQNLVEELKNFIAQNEHRFYKGNPESEKIFNPLGLVEIVGKETVYCIYPSLFKKEFCARERLRNKNC